MRRTFRDKVGWLRGYAIGSSTAAVVAFAAIAPGPTPSQGVTQDTLDQRIVEDQDDLNERLGLLYAYRNSDEEALTLKLLHMGGVADPAWQEWIRFTLAATSNKRGLSYTLARFWMSQMSITYDFKKGTSGETWAVEREVTGAAATTVILPNEEDGTTAISQDPPSWEDPPELIPEVVQTDNTLDELPSGVAVAWGNPTLITTQRQSPGWAVLHNPSGETTQAVVGDEHSPYYATGRGALNLYSLTDAALYRIEDALSQAPAITEQAALSDYHILRLVRGVNGGIAGAGIGTDSSSNYADNFASGLGANTYLVDVGHPFYTFGIGGAWSASGGRSGGGCVISSATGVSGKDEAAIYVDLGAEYTLTSASAWFATTVSGQIRSYRIMAFDNAGVQVGANLLDASGFAGDTSYAQASWTGTRAGVRYVAFGIDCNTSETDVKIDDIALAFEGGTVSVFYSTTEGTSPVEQTFGSGSIAEIGFDVSDFTSPVFIASCGPNLYYATSEFGFFVQVATIDTGGADIVLLRIPYRRPSSNALNNSNTVLQFIYGTSTADGGETLWRATFNATTNSISGATACTPNDGSEDFAPIGPNCLEVLASDATVWIGTFEGLSSGDRWLCLTINAGSSWTFLEQVDYQHAQWSTVGSQAFWLAGNDGIGRSGNRGTDLSDRTGDAQIISSITTFRGAFSIR